MYGPVYYQPIPTDTMISDRIEELKAKRKSKETKLTDRETIEISRLVRTLASRNYRARLSNKTDKPTKDGPTTIKAYVETHEDLSVRLNRLKVELAAAQMREAHNVEREKDAFEREQ